MNHIIVADLGHWEYNACWALQRRLLEKRRKEKREKQPGRNYLLLVEHPHVYTLGRSGDGENMLVGAAQLQAAQAQFVRVDRGGDITYHGPGQLVVYPVFDLEAFQLGVKEYVHLLEEVVIRTVRAYGIDGGRMEGATGVWIAPRTPAARKICAIGVKCSGYITMHGFALNVNTDLAYFNAINPCGFRDKGVTSMQRELSCVLDMERVKERILQDFSLLFRAEMSAVERGGEW